MMKIIFKFIAVITVTLIVTGCAHFRAATHATFDRNQCVNIKRQQQFLNQQYGSKEVSQIRSQRMQLQSQYQKLNCDQVIYQKAKPQNN